MVSQTSMYATWHESNNTGTFCTQTRTEKHVSVLIVVRLRALSLSYTEIDLIRYAWLALHYNAHHGVQLERFDKLLLQINFLWGT